MSAESDDIQQEFADAQEAWRLAIQAHRMAPPDAGFSARLSALAAAATQRAAACEAAYKDGFECPAARGGAKPPYELQPGTGRRGARDVGSGGRWPLSRPFRNRARRS